MSQAAVAAGGSSVQEQGQGENGHAAAAVNTNQQVVVKWSGKEYEVNISGLKTVGDLKMKIKEKTGVNVDRQKLLNLVFKGKQAVDSCALSNLSMKSGFKIMMMGSLEKDIATVDIPPELRTEITNDLDVPDDDEVEPAESREVYLEKVSRRIREYNVQILNPPREGKKLLVLDIDYTLFDHRSSAQSGIELMRPGLHDFLARSYQSYDIVIWSATSYKWIDEKMKLLGVATNPNYKITFYIDYHAMISVYTQKYGVIEVKPLGVIWGKFPQYSNRNTIMFDDLRRNFIMNPQSGLRIRPFRQAHQSRHSDRELYRLADYLERISTLDDFTHLDHQRWEAYLRSGGRTQRSSHKPPPAP